jgi:ribulose-5-phosphate 4-epimerase/fuculose-1-phosphate aldolase
MNDAKTYKQAIEQANSNLEDARECGAGAIGGSWDELRREIFTLEDIAASDLRVAVMVELVNARKERGISTG